MSISRQELAYLILLNGTEDTCNYLNIKNQDRVLDSLLSLSDQFGNGFFHSLRNQLVTELKEKSAEKFEETYQVPQGLTIKLLEVETENTYQSQIEQANLNIPEKQKNQRNVQQDMNKAQSEEKRNIQNLIVIEDSDNEVQEDPINNIIHQVIDVQSNKSEEYKNGDTLNNQNLEIFSKSSQQNANQNKLRNSLKLVSQEDEEKPKQQQNASQEKNHRPESLDKNS